VPPFPSDHRHKEQAPPPVGVRQAVRDTDSNGLSPVPRIDCNFPYLTAVLTNTKMHAGSVRQGPKGRGRQGGR
jgi:hypothetical protein